MQGLPSSARGKLDSAVAESALTGVLLISTGTEEDLRRLAVALNPTGTELDLSRPAVVLIAPGIEKSTSTDLENHHFMLMNEVLKITRSHHTCAQYLRSSRA